MSIFLVFATMQSTQFNSPSADGDKK